MGFQINIARVGDSKRLQKGNSAGEVRTAGIRVVFAFTEFPPIPRGERNRRDTKKIQLPGGNVLFSTLGFLSAE